MTTSATTAQTIISEKPISNMKYEALRCEPRT
jgi:hypothetical protein